MIQSSWSRLVTAALVSFAISFALWDTISAKTQPHSAQADLDRLIPHDKWAGAGLDKLTSAEQQSLANDISALLASAHSTDTGVSSVKDRSQWRQLKRHMTQDDVKKLLGDPVRVSVSRFYVAWYYLGGSVTFDGKGRLDAWSED